MGLVVPPPVHLPQAQPQQPLVPRPEVVQLAQTRPIATQTQRAVAGPSQTRGGEGAKSREKRAASETSEERADDVAQAGRTPRRGGITIDV